jgi:hypothetical protein
MVVDVIRSFARNAMHQTAAAAAAAVADCVIDASNVKNAIAATNGDRLIIAMESEGFVAQSEVQLYVKTGISIE